MSPILLEKNLSGRTRGGFENHLKDGGKIDYVGATDVELIGPGESAGSFEKLC